MEELFQRIREFQQYTAVFRRLISEAQAMAPTNVEGVDASGTVRVLLGSDGLPDLIRVATGWQRRLPADAVGAAVVEAFQAATRDRLDIWAKKLEEERWQFKVNKVKNALDSRTTGTSPAPLPSAFQRGPTNVTPRPLGQVTEDMLSAVDATEMRAQHGVGEQSVTGSSANRRIKVTLTGNGIHSCIADPTWAADQPAARLSSALSEALASARAALSRVIDAGQISAGGDLLGLFNEAIGILNDPLRLAD